MTNAETRGAYCNFNFTQQTNTKLSAIHFLICFWLRHKLILFCLVTALLILGCIVAFFFLIKKCVEHAARLIYTK